MSFTIRPPVGPSNALVLTNGSISLSLPQNILGGLDSLGWSDVIGADQTFKVSALRENISRFLSEGRAESVDIPAQTLEGLRQFAETGDLTEKVIVQLGTLIAACESAI
jgi:hypothetical protein